jgi:hypothetical protein
MFGSRSSKLSKGITYPERLRLPVSGPERQADYRLTGVLVHAGASVNMGHYYSYVRAPNGLWCVVLRALHWLIRPICVAFPRTATGRFDRTERLCNPNRTAHRPQV